MELVNTPILWQMQLCANCLQSADMKWKPFKKLLKQLNGWTMEKIDCR